MAKTSYRHVKAYYVGGARIGRVAGRIIARVDIAGSRWLQFEVTATRSPYFKRGEVLERAARRFSPAARPSIIPAPVYSAWQDEIDRLPLVHRID